MDSLVRQIVVCSICSMSIKKIIKDSVIELKCEKCNNIEDVLPNDHIISRKKDLNIGDEDTFNYIAKYAPHYGGNTIEKGKICQKCGLDYMTRLYLGKDNKIIYICKCETED